MLKQLNKRGDTIVEVMVVLAVLGLAIGIAYATANKSLLATRGAQESAQATALLQAQVENIRFMLPDNDLSDATKNVLQAGPYCTSDSLRVFASSTSECLKENGLYRIETTYDSSSQTFTVKATWDDVQGNDDKNTATLVYRAYKE